MREFWRQVIWYIGHPTEPYSSKVVDYSATELTEAERTEGGLRTGRVTCVLFTRKCGQCEDHVTFWAQRYTSFELIHRETNTEHRRHAIIVDYY